MEGIREQNRGEKDKGKVSQPREGVKHRSGPHRAYLGAWICPSYFTSAAPRSSIELPGAYPMVSWSAPKQVTNGL